MFLGAVHKLFNPKGEKGPLDHVFTGRNAQHQGLFWIANLFWLKLFMKIKHYFISKITIYFKKNTRLVEILVFSFV